jgi:hypothetical protein
MRIISHCHSRYSFDSPLLLSGILKELVEFSINGVILCDHDVYRLSADEESRFDDANITLFRAIEFTTSQGVHVIGVHSDIKNFERPPFTWNLRDLLCQLGQIDGVIIFPHPSHATGLFGNEKLDNLYKNDVASMADFFEINNFRYGKTFKNDVEKINKLVPGVKWLIGSDAHYRNEVSAFVNCLSSIETQNIYTMLKNSQILHEVNQNRSKLYFFIRKLKKSVLYQFGINMFSPQLRIKIKRFLGLV